MKFYNSKAEAKAHAGVKGCIFRHHRESSGRPKFYVPGKAAAVPQHIAAFSHCLMDSGGGSGNGNSNGSAATAGTTVSPIIFDIDAKAKRRASDLATLKEVQTAVRFAVFVFVKVLVEYVVRNSSRTSSSSRAIPVPKFWMCDASGPRTCNNDDKFKFSYHLLMRFPQEGEEKGSDCDDGGDDGKAAEYTFKRSASPALCKLLNKCMAAKRITFKLPNVPDKETKALHSVMEAMRATLRAEMADDDLKGGIFDEQIYKSNSLRILGAQRPTGGSELLHVDTETGSLAESIWDMDPGRRHFLQRMHAPYPSEAELNAAPSAAVPCNTTPPRIIVIDSDDDDDDNNNDDGTEKPKSASELAAMQLTGRSVPKAKISISRTNLTVGADNSNRITMETLTKLCTTIFRICCREAIPGSKLPPNYEFTFKQVKLCRHNNNNNGVLEQSLMISINHANVGGDGGQASSCIHQHHHQLLLPGQKYYYSVQAQLPFCPWKSARCRCNNSGADHNQNRVMMEIHPKGEHGDAFVEIKCFSAKCVAGMPVDKKKFRVAIARYPAFVQGERKRPTMAFSEAVFDFARLAASPGGIKGGM